LQNPDATIERDAAMALQLAQVSKRAASLETLYRHLSQLIFGSFLPQLGLTSDDMSDKNAEVPLKYQPVVRIVLICSKVESATSSDALFENRNVWLKGMRGMVQHLTADAEQVRGEKEN
jgi:hypothetical protein